MPFYHSNTKKSVRQGSLRPTARVGLRCGVGVWGEQGTLGVRLDLTPAGWAAQAVLAALRSRVTRVLGRTLPARAKCRGIG